MNDLTDYCPIFTHLTIDTVRSENNNKSKITFRCNNSVNRDIFEYKF